MTVRHSGLWLMGPDRYTFTRRRLVRRRLAVYSEMVRVEGCFERMVVPWDISKCSGPKTSKSYMDKQETFKNAFSWQAIFGFQF